MSRQHPQSTAESFEGAALLQTLERIAAEQRRALDNACPIDPLVIVVALDFNAAGMVKP